jgi:Nucleoside-diphosphate-sugar epimerases
MDEAGRRVASGTTALVVGGTGPTGPDIVEGLVRRGYQTSVFHSGKHEVPLPADVEHIHGDPHFPETINEALNGRSFDVVIAQYGRLRHLVDYLRGRAGHVVAIGGMMGPVLPPTHPRWGPLGRPAILRESQRYLVSSKEDGDTLAWRIAEASRTLFAAHEAGGFTATYIVYPNLYGPHQPGSPEWSIVRRIRDGRRKIILPDGGLRLEARGYVHNVSRAPLLAVDNPAVAAGATYVVTDHDLYTTRQRVEYIARHMGAEIEIIDMPYELATPAHPFYRHGPDHRAGMSDRIRDELGYVDRVDVATALGATLDWLLASPEATAEVEQQLGDPFDYAFEDELIAWWQKVLKEAPKPDWTFTYSHMYRHPKQVGEDWRPAAGASGLGAKQSDV